MTDLQWSNTLKGYAAVVYASNIFFTVYCVQCTLQTNKLLGLNSAVVGPTSTQPKALSSLLCAMPLSILSKSNRNDLFVTVFACSIAFQRYQTWYSKNYPKLINCQAGQKKGEVLVSLYCMNTRDVARSLATLHDVVRVYKTNREILSCYHSPHWA